MAMNRALAVAAPKNLITADEMGLIPPDAMREVLTANLGEGVQIGPFSLPSIKMPIGTAKQFTVDDISGPETVNELTGVVALWRGGRSYWSTAYTGEAVLPDCKSNDLVHGDGNPGGMCRGCPMAKFAEDGGGAKCREFRLLFVLRPGCALPSLLRVPRTSLGEWFRYTMGLSSRGIPYFQVVTKIVVETVKVGNFPTAVAKFAFVGQLDPAAGMAELNKSLTAMFSSVDFAGAVEPANGNGNGEGITEAPDTEEEQIPF